MVRVRYTSPSGESWYVHFGVRKASNETARLRERTGNPCRKTSVERNTMVGGATGEASGGRNAMRSLAWRMPNECRMAVDRVGEA